MKIYYWLYIIPALLMLGACGYKPASLQEYMRYLDDPTNGLVQVRKVNGYVLSVKYLPAEFLAYKDLKEDHLQVSCRDSLVSLYKNNFTFVLTIGPDEAKGNKTDVTMSNISSLQEHAERLMSMNFGMEEMITLQTGSEKLHPILSNMENTYGLGTSRSMIFVFAPEQESSLDKMDFTYEDEMFGAGILHFVFEKDKTDNIPGITFWNK